jgi:FixJ family two-component response regulator
MSVQALRKGAINFLQKPVDDVQLLGAVSEAVTESKKLLSERTEIARIRSLFSTLTSREADVLRCLITGMLNKQIAAELGIVEQTVKVHRGRITMKLHVKSVAEMVRMAEKVHFQ